MSVFQDHSFTDRNDFVVPARPIGFHVGHGAFLRKQHAVIRIAIRTAARRVLDSDVGLSFLGCEFGILHQAAQYIDIGLKSEGEVVCTEMAKRIEGD